MLENEYHKIDHPYSKISAGGNFHVWATHEPTQQNCDLVAQ